MSSKGLLFIGFFAVCSIGALFLPHLGVYGYIADYCLNPAGQWWGRPFVGMGMRFSFILAAATMAGIFLQRKKLKFGEKLFLKQEIYLLFFLVTIWVLFFISPETVGRYTSTDHPVVKLTKVIIFTMMMTHIFTDMKKINGLFWVLITVSLLLGIKAHDVPYSAFMGGRLEGIGGVDFSEANYFGAFMATMLPLIGTQFLCGKTWYIKLYCLVAGVFTVNTVILCRSRGAFLGLVIGGVAALFYAPKEFRKKILIFILVGISGVVYLTDDIFIKRIMTISTKQEKMDESSSSRILLWKAGVKMFVDNPLGIGPGNWYQTTTQYIPEYERMDSHSTYVKCFVELGVQGFLLFSMFVVSIFRGLAKVKRKVDLINLDYDYVFKAYALIVSLVILLTCSVTMTLIYAEFFWILFCIPICLYRALENVENSGQ